MASLGWVGTRRWWLGLIVAGHVCLGLAYNFITPVFEGPDEPNHFLYIRHLQATGSLPVQGVERDAVRAHHPPGYFWLGALLTAWDAPNASGEFGSLGLLLNPRYWFRLGDPEPDLKSVFLHHTPDERWPYRGLPLTVHVARLLSLAFSTLAVALTYRAARYVWPTDPAPPLLAAGLLAFNPMLAFMAGVVQNDTAALAAGAALVLALSRCLRRGFGWRDWAVVGAALGVGIMLKAGLLALGAVVAAGVVYAAWCAGVGARDRLRRMALNGAAVALPVLVIAGWWLLRNQQLYGDWTGNVTITALWGPLSPEQRRAFLPLALYTLATGLLGRFGNGGIIEFSRAAYAGAGVIVLGALTGLLRLARPALARLNWRQPPPLSAALWAIHGLTVLIITASVLAFALNFNGGATGKYLFPAFPSLAILLAGGALAWLGPRWRGLAATGLLLLTLAASVYALFGLLLPAYGPPRRPLPLELDRATPLEADLGGVVRLLGYHLPSEAAHAGSTYRVTVYWLPQATTPTPYTVFVHLYVPGVGTVAQRDLYPGGGAYPTTVWAPGRPFVDTFYLHLPAGAPSAANAQVLIGLYDEATGQRLPATGANAGPPGADWIEFGAIAIQP